MGGATGSGGGGALGGLTGGLSGGVSGSAGATPPATGLSNMTAFQNLGALNFGQQPIQDPWQGFIMQLIQGSGIGK